MVRVKDIKENPNCVASITVRARKVSKGTSMQIGNESRKILGILHHSTNTATLTHDPENKDNT